MRKSGAQSRRVTSTPRLKYDPCSAIQNAASRRRRHLYVSVRMDLTIPAWLPQMYALRFKGLAVALAGAYSIYIYQKYVQMYTKAMR